MQVSPISFAYNTNRTAASFKGADRELYPAVTPDTPDDKIVCYSSCGPNYIFPVYARDIKARLAQMSEQAPKVEEPVKKETPEEYYARKIYSTEWCM